MRKAKLWSVNWQSRKYEGDYGHITVNTRNALEAIKKSKLPLREIEKVELIGTED